MRVCRDKYVHGARLQRVLYGADIVQIQGSNAVLVALSVPKLKSQEINAPSYQQGHYRINGAAKAAIFNVYLPTASRAMEYTAPDTHHIRMPMKTRMLFQMWMLFARIQFKVWV